MRICLGLLRLQVRQRSATCFRFVRATQLASVLSTLVLEILVLSPQAAGFLFYLLFAFYAGRLIAFFCERLVFMFTLYASPYIYMPSLSEQIVVVRIWFTDVAALLQMFAERNRLHIQPTTDTTSKCPRCIHLTVSSPGLRHPDVWELWDSPSVSCHRL